MRALGFEPADIRWTVLTHLHLDHDGGLEHALDSEIIVTAGRVPDSRSGFAGRLRGYLPHRWPEGFAPRHGHAARSEPYGPFPHSLELARGVVLVGTPGPHARPHVGRGRGRAAAAASPATPPTARQRSRDGVPDGHRDQHADAARATMARIRDVPGRARDRSFLPTHDPDAPARLARYGDQHRRFRPRIVQDAQGDAVEPEQVTPAEAPRGPGDAA